VYAVSVVRPGRPSGGAPLLRAPRHQREIRRRRRRRRRVCDERRRCPVVGCTSLLQVRTDGF